MKEWVIPTTIAVLTVISSGVVYLWERVETIKVNQHEAVVYIGQIERNGEDLEDHEIRIRSLERKSIEVIK